jgi:hypothetical protein
LRILTKNSNFERIAGMRTQKLVDNEKREIVEVKQQRLKIVVSERMTDYLQQLARYRFLTAEQITRLNHKMTGLTAVRTKMRQLVLAEYVNATVIPTKKRNSANIFTLGTRGARLLEKSEVDVKKFYTPEELEDLGHDFLWHVLQLNDFIISANRVIDENTGWYLDSFVHDFEIEKRKIRFEAVERYQVLNGKEYVEKEKKVTRWIEPDTLLVFRKKLDNGKIRQAVYILELDRGSESEGYFKQKIENYYYAITSGALLKYFGVNHFDGIIWSTTAKSTNRVALMQKHTMNVLGGLHAKQQIVDLFLFNTQPERVTEINVHDIFFSPVWRFGLKERPPIALLV